MSSSFTLPLRGFRAQVSVLDRISKMPLFSCFSDCTKTRNPTKTQSSTLPYNICRTFSLSQIKAATNNFNPDNIIGHGTFSEVYKGHIDDTPVAISRLNTMSEQGSRMFKTEVRLLCQLQHPNIVSFIGLHDHGRDIILVNEYLPYGTLHDRLYDPNTPLEWTDRLKICIDSARGLQYLHTGAKLRILHRDVKPKNILIGNDMTAKVSDFGLSRLIRHAYDVVDGYLDDADMGYADGEVIATGRFSSSSDVYSFGVVLFEVLCAKKPWDKTRGEDRSNLLRWACRCVKEGSVDEVVDPYLVGRIAPDCLGRFVEIGASCVFNKATDRAAIGEVVERLEEALQLQESSVPSPGGGPYSYQDLQFSVSHYWIW